MALTRNLLQTQTKFTFGKDSMLFSFAFGRSRYSLKFQCRHLNVHEFISYSILKDNGVPVPKFGVATSSKEAMEIAKSIGDNNLIMKAQVLTGGRGVGKFMNSGIGGVIPFEKICLVGISVNSVLSFSPEKAKDLASKMIGDTLVTIQTGPKGKICNKVMIAQRKPAKKEYYMSITMERSFQGPVIIFSREGGVEIEKVAAKNPQAIKKTPIDIEKGLDKLTAEAVAEQLGFEGKKENVGQILLKLYDIFIKTDASLIEINPFIEDLKGNLFCLDAKINFDDNADFRQKEIFALRDFTQENPNEVKAAKFSLNYIALDGDIGCMVNGAGLAMATLDIIKLSGGDPANFLDVGGGASAEQVKEAFKIITSDPNVSAVLVNIFGGIMRCDIIAEGIIAAAKELNLNLPIIARLQGTNYLEAKERIKNSNLNILVSDDLAEAACYAVKLSDISKIAKEIEIVVKFEIPKQ